MSTENSALDALRAIVRDARYPASSEDAPDGAVPVPFAKENPLKCPGASDVEYALAELFEIEEERAAKERAEAAARTREERSRREARESSLREEAARRLEKAEERASAARAKESTRAAARVAELEHQRQVEAFLRSLPEELKKAFNGLPALQGALAERLFRISEFLEEAAELRMLSVKDVLDSLVQGKRPLSEKEMHISDKEIFINYAEEVRRIATELVDNVRKLNSLRSPK